MQLHVTVLLNSLIEAVRSPSLRKEAQRNGLTETVQLQTAAAASIHNGGVVNHLHIDIPLPRTNPQVGVRRRTTFHEQEAKRNPNTSPTTRNAVFPAAALSRITSAFDSTRSRSAIMTFLPKNSSFPLVRKRSAYQLARLYSQNGGVVLEKNLVAALHSLQSLDSDVLLVSKSQTNEIQHRRCFERKRRNPRFLSTP